MAGTPEPDSVQLVLEPNSYDPVPPGAPEKRKECLPHPLGQFEIGCEGGSREEAHATDRRKAVLAAADDGGVSGNMPPRPLGK